MNKCSICGAWYSGSHSCGGTFTYPTGSNPPSVSEVAGFFGEDYLHPHTVSENE